MKIYTLTSMGKYHPLHCEDNIFYQYVGSKYLVAAVMDGCSSGVESHFAATLYGKSLKKSSQMLPDLKQVLPDLDVERMGKEAVGKFILGQLYEDLKKVRKSLLLNLDEILSTIVLMIYDLNENAAWINISGDGLVVCNGILKEIDQENMPDYLAYHLDIKFDDWLQNQTQTLEYKNIRDISISTDGITKLKKNPQRVSRDVDIIDLFLIQEPKGSQERALFNTYLSLIEEEQYITYDDLGIIRLMPSPALCVDN